MLPRKRARADEYDREMAPTSRDLIQNHFPELNVKEKRVQLFQAFEFPDKQKILKEYWEKTLAKFFQVNYDGCVVPWARVQEVFRVANSFPLGLGPIVLKLWDERKITLLKDMSERELVLPLISNYVVPKKSVGTFEAIASFFRKPVNCLTPDTLVIHTSTFKGLYSQVLDRLAKVFPEAPMILEDVFDSNFREEFGDLKDAERPLIIFALFALKVLTRVTKLEQTFVCYRAEKLNDGDMERLGNINVLEKKIAGIEIQETQVGRQMEELKKRALDHKNAGRASESKRVLNEYLIKKKRLEKLNTIRMYLASSLNKIHNAKEDSEAAAIIQQTTDLLRKAEGSMDKMLENIEAMNDFDIKNEQMDDLLKQGAGYSKLDQDYAALDEIPEVEHDESVLDRILSDSKPGNRAVANGDALRKPSAAADESKDLLEETIRRLNE